MGGLLVLTGIAFLTGAVGEVELLAVGHVSGAGQDRLTQKEARREGGLPHAIEQCAYIVQPEAGHST